MLLSIALVTYNVEYLDYCLESTIRCGMDLADEICVNDGNSTDGTYDVLLSLQQEYGKDRLRIERRDWYHDFYWEEKERNYSFQMCKGDWIFVLDTDECFHEDSIPKVRDLIETIPEETVCIRFPILNFYGTKDFIHPRTHDLPFLERHAKIGRRKNNFRVQAMENGNPAELFADFEGGSHQLHGYTGNAQKTPKNKLSKFGPSGRGDTGIPRVWDCNEKIYHYTFMRDARAQGVKRRKIGSWVNYTDQNSEFFNGYLPTYEETPYSYDMTKSCLIPFTGTHPKYMESWFKKKDRVLVWTPHLGT